MGEPEDLAETGQPAQPSAGDRLRAAREAQGLSVEDIAARTRIPTRHLENIEAGNWDKMPSSTYSIGFAKSYAAALGLDRAEIAEQLRTELSQRSPAHVSDYHEPADPKRVPPKS